MEYQINKLTNSGTRPDGADDPEGGSPLSKTAAFVPIITSRNGIIAYYSSSPPLIADLVGRSLGPVVAESEAIRRAFQERRLKTGRSTSIPRFGMLFALLRQQACQPRSLLLAFGGRAAGCEKTFVIGFCLRSVAQRDGPEPAMRSAMITSRSRGLSETGDTDAHEFAAKLSDKGEVSATYIYCENPRDRRRPMLIKAIQLAA